MVGWGGAGKTSLVSKWAADLAKRGLEKICYFDWSFYSQGTRDQTTVSADAFIAAALEFFGDRALAHSAASPRDKGARLAELVNIRRTLLILDGLEPLQHPPSSALAGHLKDPALATLLRGLAQRNAGLCVITSRERVADVANYRDATAPEIQLQGLSLEAGVELIKRLGVQGTESEIRELVEEVKGHALTLTLTGRYIAQAHLGDIRKRDRLCLEKADVLAHGSHAFKVMEAYERWLGAGGQTGERQLAILRMLGLFDRPVETKCLKALCAHPPIPTLTEQLVGLNESEWNISLQRLVECGLAVLGQDQTKVDSHPLIREYFAQRIRVTSCAAAEAAHARIFQYLEDARSTVEESSLLANEYLCRAIMHACLAAREQEGWRLYWRQLVRQQSSVFKRPHHTQQRRAAGAMLSVLTGFFEEPWRIPRSALASSEAALALGEAGHYLFILGRYDEARFPLETALGHDRLQNEESLVRAARYARLLREMHLVRGEIREAYRQSVDAVELAVKSNDPVHLLLNKAAKAQVLHQQGAWDDAQATFMEAEKHQSLLASAESENNFQWLFGIAGFWHTLFLIEYWERFLHADQLRSTDVINTREQAITAFTEIIQRAEHLIAQAKKLQNAAFDCGHGELALGLALFHRSRVTDSPEYERAMAEINKAVTHLRMTGQQHHYAQSLVIRAQCRAKIGDNDGAKADLSEASQIAERSSMRIFMADIRLIRAEWDRDKEALNSARAIIEECGYWKCIDRLKTIETESEEWG